MGFSNSFQNVVEISERFALVSSHKILGTNSGHTYLIVNFILTRRNDNGCAESRSCFFYVTLLTTLDVDERPASTSMRPLPIWNNLCHSKKLERFIIASRYTCVIISKVSLAVFQSSSKTSRWSAARDSVACSTVVEKKYWAHSAKRYWTDLLQNGSKFKQKKPAACEFRQLIDHSGKFYDSHSIRHLDLP